MRFQASSSPFRGPWKRISGHYKDNLARTTNLKVQAPKVQALISFAFNAQNGTRLKLYLAAHDLYITFPGLDLGRPCRKFTYAFLDVGTVMQLDITIALKESGVTS